MLLNIISASMALGMGKAPLFVAKVIRLGDWGGYRSALKFRSTSYAAAGNSLTPARTT